MTSCDINLSSFSCFNSKRTQGQSSSFSATLAQTGTPFSYLTSFMSHTWIIDSGATDHMTENRGIMSSFTSTSNFAVLADGFRTTIQGVGTATTSFTLSLAYVLYLPHFPFSLLSISKITKILNCTVTFFPDRSVFKELGTREWHRVWAKRIVWARVGTPSGSLHQHFFSIWLLLSIRSPFSTCIKAFFPL